jgi:hypothetical protein
VTRKKNLQQAIERVRGKALIGYEKPQFAQPGGIYTLAAQSPNWSRVTVGGNSAEEGPALSLLNELPSIAEDNLLHGEVLVGLVALVAQQQKQIDVLRGHFDAMMNGMVGVKVQESMQETLMALAREGSDVKRPEVRVTLTGALKSAASSSEKHHSTGKREDSSTTSVHAGVKGLMKVLAGFKFDVDLEKSGALESIQEMERQSSLSIDETRSAEVVMSFESISGAPVKKAEAHAIKSRGAKRPKRKRRPSKA